MARSGVGGDGDGTWSAWRCSSSLSPAVYSYSTTMLQPSSLPLGVRSVEWLRNHHGNWLVDEVEHVYYTLEGAEEGRPAAEGAAGGRRRARAHAPKAWPPRIKPVFATPLAG